MQSATWRALIAHEDANCSICNAVLEQWVRNPGLPDEHINQMDKMYVGLFEVEHLYYELV